MSGQKTNPHQLKHVAIVPDGNGRWARRRLMPRVAGHHVGAQAVRKAVEFSVENNLEILTLFALSVENYFHRPANEVQLLLKLFLESLRDNLTELNQQNVRLRIVGDRSLFDKTLLSSIEKSEAITAKNTGLELIMALNYSGRWDIVQAAQRLCKEVLAGKLQPEEITEFSFQKQLCLSELPEPDLLIRTGGEQRISNFMLWQFAYTELYFTDIYWPDFDKQAYQKAIDFYYSKQRRFGRVTEQVTTQYA
ncbi:MAG: di-trans,poly-cis-decaprenylcistransferase [Proteobacteria bacterium]|nr:di-trans,poly-cis-decaprenylcistransferase [Pseudomonadota bacterium]